MHHSIGADQDMNTYHTTTLVDRTRTMRALIDSQAFRQRTDELITHLDARRREQEQDARETRLRALQCIPQRFR